MVGGTVIETIDTGDRVWVNCKDREHGDECAIYVERTVESRSISVGDHVWWQGRHAMWTPKRRPFGDRRLVRIGCSGVNRPDARTAQGGA